MSEQTPNLHMPYIMAAQSQKHVTHNEAIRALDAIVQLSVRDRSLTVPPGSPSDGSRYVPATAATGAWAGREDCIAAWQDGAWMFHEPQPGWLAWVEDEQRLMCWDGVAWIDTVADALNPVPFAGVNAVADVTNRLSVSAPGSLFNHEGASHRLAVNKAATSDTASQVFQTAASGRAEVGLAGDDDLHFRTSVDGSTWRDVLVCAAATGTPRVPSVDVADLPLATAAGAGALVFVPDEAGGAVLAYSDGADWRRVTDAATVS